MSTIQIHQQEIRKQTKIRANLKFKPRDDGITGPCDYFNYNFPTRNLFYRLTTPIMRFIIQLGWNVKIHGKNNIPKKSNAIFMPNHVSHFDSFLVGTRFPTTPIGIIDEKLFKNKLFAKIATQLNGFPVRKGTKSVAIVDYAIQRVNKGDSLLWFPEGQRHKEPWKNKLNPGKLGSGMLAHGVTAPIIPVFIEGAEFAMPVGKKLRIGKGPKSIKINVTYGKPVELDDLRDLKRSKETSQKVVDRIMQAIEDLRPKGSYKVQKV